MKLVLGFKGSSDFLNKSDLREAVEVILKQNLIETGVVEVSIEFVKDKRMRELNKKYMGKDEPTDVLSFPLEKEKGPDGVIRLGDVVINLDHLERKSEAKFLVSHGVKHLLGIHHD